MWRHHTYASTYAFYTDKHAHTHPAQPNFESVFLQQSNGCPLLEGKHKHNKSLTGSTEEEALLQTLGKFSTGKFWWTPLLWLLLGHRYARLIVISCTTSSRGWWGPSAAVAQLNVTFFGWPRCSGGFPPPPPPLGKRELKKKKKKKEVQTRGCNVRFLISPEIK